MATTWPPRTVIRKSSGLRTLESALHRSGLGPVAGVDEVGRGACAGPLVVAACVLGPGRMESLAALDDSKKLTEAAREKLFPLIRRYALAYHVVFIPPTEVDRRGVHVANIEGMRRAVAGLSVRPGYVLSDGFRVPGLAVPSLPVIGGDAVAACIAAASVLAKVSRDRLMVAMDGIDAVLMAWGGGGLTTGVASALAAVSPATRVIACEPETGAPLTASLAAGAPVEVDYRPSFVDGAGSKALLAPMWDQAQRLVSAATAVTLRDAAEAVALLATRARVVAEGAGSLPVAAALAGHGGGGRVVCVVSGGNIDAERLAEILRGGVPG